MFQEWCNYDIIRINPGGAACYFPGDMVQLLQTIEKSGYCCTLYNRALALSKLGRREEEKDAWHRYLAVNSSGRLVRNAVEHLNALGDFSYRNYILGGRLVTVKVIAFDTSGTEGARASHPSLEIIGETVAGMASGVLQVVVYCKVHTDLAKVRTLNIRRQLLKSGPGLCPERLVSVGSASRNRKKKWNIEECVDFFLINK